MKTRSRLGFVGDLVLIVACVVVAGTVVYGQFFQNAPNRGAIATQQPEYWSDWHAILGIGVSTGSGDAPIQVIEFGDLECPACREFHHIWTDLSHDSQYTSALTFVHFPLSQHRFAIPSAQAVECAERQDRGAALIALFYAKQDSLGLKTWESYASEAMVPDAAAFTECTESQESMARVEAGMALGEMLGVNATPTIVVNGWRFPLTPDRSALVAAFDDISRGEPPFADYRVIDTELTK